MVGLRSERRSQEQKRKLNAGVMRGNERWRFSDIELHGKSLAGRQQEAHPGTEWLEDPNC
jgi:hypothetical protein